MRLRHCFHRHLLDFIFDSKGSREPFYQPRAKFEHNFGDREACYQVKDNDLDEVPLPVQNVAHLIAVLVEVASSVPSYPRFLHTHAPLPRGVIFAYDFSEAVCAGVCVIDLRMRVSPWLRAHSRSPSGGRACKLVSRAIRILRMRVGGARKGKGGRGKNTYGVSVQVFVR